jgi:hypothetical protein
VIDRSIFSENFINIVFSAYYVNFYLTQEAMQEKRLFLLKAIPPGMQPALRIGHRYCLLPVPVFPDPIKERLFDET